MTDTIKNLLANNQQWAEKTQREHPELFQRLASGQSPEVLWIGCSDSRVPETTITNAQPGDFFVHRNIANLVVPTDANLLSVLDYAVNVLKVKHIVICGHYGCGGAQAAMSTQSFGYIDHWLLHLKTVYRQHQAELEAIENEQHRWNRFVELNVIAQVQNLARLPFIQAAWKNNDYPQLHGLVYDLSDGLLRTLDIEAC